jgi:preprotein translocase subunit SecA
MSFLGKIFSNSHTSSVKKFEPMAAKINALEAEIQALSDAELRAKTDEFRKRLNVAETLDDILPEAFAVVREAARRTLSQRHFDVQLVGGMVLHSGAISEMRTGEGKTLVATLPAYLNALTGKGVHIVTVNDYLSRRDTVWMGQVYDFLGLSVGVINHEASFLYDSSAAMPAGRQAPVEAATSVDLAKPTKTLRRAEEGAVLDKERDITGGFRVVHEFLRPCTRREAYAADITYGTNNEFGFDYLRDNLEYSPPSLRQRDFNFAIVDEIDSILIDEARTPLIISAPTRDAESTYKQFAALVSTFKENEDYTTDEKRKAISLLPPGIEKAEKSLGIDNIYTDKGIKFVHHLETAVRAKALFHLDKEYVIRDNQIVIVDEFTGRLQPGRRWSEGLHQAIEAKEGVSVQQESRTYASITFQNFFRMYPKLSGMTGTAATSSEEFYKVYGLEVFIVPTNQPMVRLDQNDQIFRTEAGKYKAIARKVKESHTKGQPVLIGTVSIEKNELLSQFLKSEGIPHTILNAKPEYAEREGETVAQAGKKSAVTIATNMAGRGVDIKLGGNPNTPDVYHEVKAAGGLFVLGTERHEARRIDNQLRGRSGRQGDPGETQFFVSLEDSLMRVFASDTLKSMMGRLGMPEDEAIEHRIISKSLESAQEKIEGFNFDSRKHVLEFDDVINTQRAVVYGRRRRLLLGTIDDVERELIAIVADSGAAPRSAANMGSSPTVGSSGNTEKALGAAFSRRGILSKQTLKSQPASEEGSEPMFDSASRSGEDIFSILQKKIKEFGRENFLNAMRIILLQTIDMYWVEHLEVMDYTRGSVNLRAYGQRDPLVEYKKEGLRLFKEMQSAMREQVMRILPNITPVINGRPATSSNNSESAQLKEVHENARIIGAGDGSGSQLIKKEPQLGRNDPCWCGSGKKYKKCHGK